MELLNPLNDFVFKYLLGTEANKIALIDFVNAVLKRSPKIIDLQLLNPFNPKTWENDKASVLDIKAQLSDKSLVNVEVQLRENLCFDRRILYYWSKLYTGSIMEGEDYGSLNKTNLIIVANYRWIEDERYHHQYHLVEDKDATNRFMEMMEIHKIARGCNDIKESSFTKADFHFLCS